MQIVEANDLWVRVAKLHLTRPATPLRFVLYPMLHVGSPEFFAEVQRRLAQADVVVLEGVGGSRAVRGLTRGYRRVARSEALGLTLQHPEKPRPSFDIVRGMAWLRRRKEQINDPAWDVHEGDVLALSGPAVKVAVREIIPPERGYPYKRVVLEFVTDDNTRRPVDLREGNDSWTPVGEPAEPKSLADLPSMMGSVSSHPGSVITPGLAMVTAVGPPEPADSDVADAGFVRVATLAGSSRVDGFALTVTSWQELVDRLGRATLS